jgi:hypothetical protein
MKSTHPTTLTGSVLMFLANQDGKWATWGPSFYMPTVQAVLPVGTKEEVQFRFMRRLQTLGLVSGCDCGCRGDYTPTFKGMVFLATECFYGEREQVRWEKEGYGYGY